MRSKKMIIIILLLIGLVALVGVSWYVSTKDSGDGSTSSKNGSAVEQKEAKELALSLIDTINSRDDQSGYDKFSDEFKSVMTYEGWQLWNESYRKYDITIDKSSIKFIKTDSTSQLNRFSAKAPVDDDSIKIFIDTINEENSWKVNDVTSSVN
ncbi:MAG: hypothetical protein L0H36_02390 [bacterium]|nr:hypothetical protein [bacterium]